MPYDPMGTFVNPRGKRGFGRFATSLLGSIRENLAQRRAGEALEQQRLAKQAQDLGMMEREYQLRGELEAGKPQPAGDTIMEEFARWRRGKDPSGWGIEPALAYPIFELERALPYAKTEEEKSNIRTRLDALELANRRGQSAREARDIAMLSPGEMEEYQYLRKQKKRSHEEAMGAIKPPLQQ